MRRSIRHVNAGLLAWSLVVGDCTSILGINNDYREPDGGTGGGGPGAGGGGLPSAVSSSSSGARCGVGRGSCTSVPAGWSPLWVKSGADPTLLPGPCADASLQRLYFTNPAGAPACSACGCALGAGAPCGEPQISC